jgi:hypothetical protein
MRRRRYRSAQQQGHNRRKGAASATSHVHPSFRVPASVWIGQLPPSGPRAPGRVRMRRVAFLPCRRRPQSDDRDRPLLSIRCPQAPRRSLWLSGRPTVRDRASRRGAARTKRRLGRALSSESHAESAARPARRQSQEHKRSRRAGPRRTGLNPASSPRRSSAGSPRSPRAVIRNSG